MASRAHANELSPGTFAVGGLVRRGGLAPSSMGLLRFVAAAVAAVAAVGCSPSSGTDTVSTGGRPGTGGATSGTSGGNSGSTGGAGTGGSISGSGGGNGSGGSVGSGGNVGSGGSTASGGAPGSGGSTGSGGAAGGSGGAVGTGGAGGTLSTGGAPATTFAVVTNRYDNARSGSNLNETILNTTNVKPTTFGLLFSRAINGYVYSQPLYVGGLTINGAKHNVVYVVTEHNMIYAFDADSPTASAPLWSKMLGTALILGGGGYDPGCSDMRNEVGITSTPVISLADNKIYVVAKTSTDQELHALDLATGEEGVGSPVSVGKTAMPALDVRIHLNRASLLLLNGVIYISFGSHCDAGDYKGWIFGYDAKALTLKSVYNTSPTGTRGAIWQSGTGPASDGTDLFVTVGNGSTGGNNMGNNVVRLTPSGAGLNIAARYQSAVSGDNDLQSGAVLLGTSGQVVGGGKDGDILLLGQSDMSRKQQIAIGGEVNAFVYWNGSAGPTLFAWSSANNLRSFKVGAGTLTAGPQNAERKPGHPSAIFTVSSNGTQAGTGILWANVPLSGDAWHATATGGLYAFDAADVSKPSLWNSTINAADNLGTYAKYSTPTVANGKVYVATFSGKLMVYGLK